MFSSIQISLGNFIKNKIIMYTSRKGITIKIKRAVFSGLNLNLDKVIVFNKTKNAIIEIDKISFRILFWRTLCNLSLVGELEFHNISSNWNVISDKTFIIGHLDITFKLRTINKIILNVEIDNISSLLFFHKTKKNIELYLDLPSITWNDIIGICKDHFCFQYLQSLESSDKITLIAYVKKYLSSLQVPFFNAKIDSDDFLLKNKNSNEVALINNDFLVKALYKKRGYEFQSNYIVFDEIPTQLINSVICSEDPNYWDHCGIDFFFIGYAFDTNIKNNKITRGASTITMQLVRNLFLHHNRTIMRKLEETIITILLENYFKIDKKTIFELYINIIEFAPKIYGIKNASSFYFNKTPSELTLIENLVLTYIIPRPKHFLEALEIGSIQLKQNLRNHINMYSNVLLNKKLITMEEYNSIGQQIVFSKTFGVLDLIESNQKENFRYGTK